ncbi:MAG TPA: chorismate-binding protein, partial [Elusimicrobiota bacterium]|nr:chorismate-binding protein [Elusimicrobiota bacterium]
MIRPSQSEFVDLARQYNVIPVSQETLVDRVTPVSVYERLQRGEDHAFLLESVEGGEQFGRYSFVGQRPRALFTSRDNRVTYQEGQRRRTWTTSNPVQELKAIFAQYSAAPLKELPRFWGGAVGYWNYDTARFFEKLPDSKPDSMGFDTGAFQLSSELVIFDRLAQIAQVMAVVHIPADQRTRPALIKLYRQAQRSIERQLRRIHDRSFTIREKRAGVPQPPKPLQTQQEYESAVERGQEYIRAGDIIQVVLSRRWVLKPNASPFQIYRALRVVNPSPYMYHLHFPNGDIVGSSPELLVRKENDLAETRPIAGTRRRGANRQEDEALAAELRRDPKERAEHLMLLDLGR